MPASPSTSPAPPPIVELKDVKRTYFKPDGSILVQALRGLSLAIPKGQYMAIMGASGSGKSTLMNLLGCLDKPTSGAYFLDSENVAALSDEALSAYRGRKIGFIFQAFNLIPQLTIRENVEVPLFYQGVPPRLRRDRAVQQLSAVGLAERLDHRPSELSGGQQQRAAIARALVTSPVVLMADEPTGNLDSATGQAVLEIFENLHAQGITIIMVTHDHEIAARCQRIVRLRDGVMESDTLPA